MNMSPNQLSKMKKITPEVQHLEKCCAVAFIAALSKSIIIDLGFRVTLSSFIE